MPAPTSPDAGSRQLPPEFPREVPVVDGRYRTIESDAVRPPAQVIEVSELGSAPLSEAVHRLVAAGYEEQDFLGQKTFFGPRHLVTVSESDNGFAPVLLYLVTPTSALSGFPAIPEIDLDSLFGDVGQG
ncbi:hypothetical protein [Gordonia hirsuta]|uniref:hypothetical protein n=1 Tax=Gordonia hirsuta TaxID=53427 RepID=UPI0012DE8B34|nr:hypothetical protein [Gordonia hirsuta]